MRATSRKPVDYLVIGHLTKDRRAGSCSLGGTVAYAGLAAHALGCRVAVLTAAAGDLDLREVTAALEVSCRPSRRTTILETLAGAGGRRRQRLVARAEVLLAEDLPAAWRQPRIVHFGPIADEVDPGLVGCFRSPALRAMTPQGWLRWWDEDGVIRRRPWRHVEPLLGAADAVVLSLEDLGGDEAAAEEMAAACPVLAVTAGAGATRVYSEGREQRFVPPPVREVDSTGAGDVFAAAFFHCFADTGDPWHASVFATRLAAASTTRSGLAGVPVPAEIEAARRGLPAAAERQDP